MTLHVCLRTLSLLLLLFVTFLRVPPPASAQAVAAPPASPVASPPPPLAERLERLAAEFDRNRIDLHVPGAESRPTTVLC